MCSVRFSWWYASASPVPASSESNDILRHIYVLHQSRGECWYVFMLEKAKDSVPERMVKVAREVALQSVLTWPKRWSSSRTENVYS